MVLRPLYRCDSRPDPSTLADVGEDDWLERGHGGGEGLQPLIKGSSGRAADRVSIRSVLRGTTPPRTPRRRTKALVGWLLYCATAVGGTAAAFTVRDTLFPALGAPTKRGVWATSNVDTTVSVQHGSTTTMSRDVVVLEAAMQQEIVESASQSSIDAATVPTAPADEQAPNSSIDRDPGGNRGPAGTVAVTDEGPASGPGPGTTIDEHPTDTSTPPTLGEPTPPTTADPNVTTITGDVSGKGKGGGGGGGGGGDGGPTTTLP